jgi:hypothetical protein
MRNYSSLLQKRNRVLVVKRNNMKVIKYISGDMIYEEGDFFGGDTENDVIKGMFIANLGHTLDIFTNHTHSIPIKMGDWAKFEDGTSLTFDQEEDDVADDAGTE